MELTMSEDALPAGSAPAEATASREPAALSPAEIRVLGALIEKQLTTPEYYPLTLNALTAACNQKNNRDPVLTMDDKSVLRAIDELRNYRLVWQVSQAGGRTPKYQHDFAAVYGTTLPETALLCELMLRGPQTIGELRTHASRMTPLPDLASVEAILGSLVNRQAGALATPLPRETGRREIRYAHLLGGPVAEAATETGAPPAEAARLEILNENQRLNRLEETVTRLRTDLDDLIRRLSPLLDSPDKGS
jgi:uncharacterized protein